MFCLLLSLLQLFLHSNFSTDSCLKDLFGNSSIDGLKPFFFLLELLLGDGWLLEIVSFLIFREPLGELVVVLEVEATIGAIDNLVSRAIPEHFLSNGQSLG